MASEHRTMPRPRGIFDRAGFRRLMAAQSVSSFGDWLATFALMALVLDISGSAAAVGGVLALRLAPAALAGPLVGWIGSRWGRRRILLTLDGLRAGAVALIPFVRSLWWVYPWTLLIELAAVLAITARDASIRDLVETDDLPLANGMVMGATYGAIPVGAGVFTAISALVWAGGRFFVAFWLDALTFLTSFWFISRIREIPDEADLTPASGHHIRLRDAWQVPVVRLTLPPVVAASLGIGTLFSLGITFVRDALGATDAQFGLLVLVFGVGAAAGLAVRQITGWGGVKAVRIGVQAMGVVLLLMSLASGLLVTFLMAALFGTAGAYAIVSGLTVLQTDLDDADQLLALGGFHVGVRMALAAGALAAGLAADLVGRVGGFGVIGLDEPIRVVMLLAGIVVVGAAWLVRPTRRPGSQATSV